MTKSSAAVRKAAKKIKLLILDVDGVLTDGSIILDNKGNELKSFNVRDGHGITMLLKSGIGVAIITGRQSRVVEHRAEELGITEVFQKCRDKRAAYETLKKRHGLEDAEVAYVGDDIVDLPVMQQVGLPVAVSDAVSEIKPAAALITTNPGGRGAVREVTDLILKSRGLWNKLFDEYVTA